MLTLESIKREIDDLVKHGDNRADIATLADLYVCMNAMSKTGPGYSGEMNYTGDSEFAQAIQGKDINTVMAVVDEAMTAVKTLVPRLYSGVMQKLNE